MNLKWSAENPDKVEWEWLNGSEVTHQEKMPCQVADTLQYMPSRGDVPKWPAPAGKLIASTERR